MNPTSIDVEADCSVTSIIDTSSDDDESSNDDDDDSYLLPDFMPPARVIMNRPPREKSSFAIEARIFRELFGTNLRVVENVWFLLNDLEINPEGGLPKHLLWAFHFMKAYPLQAQGCAAVGGSDGAVDPKTYRKWVWAYIEAISDLELEVVSLLSHVFVLIINTLLTHLFPLPCSSATRSRQHRYVGVLSRRRLCRASSLSLSPPHSPSHPPSPLYIAGGL
jgi:hypothetical protein